MTSPMRSFVTCFSPTRRAAERRPSRPSATGAALATMATLLFISACGGGDSPSGPDVETVARVDVSAPTTTLAPAQTVQFTATAKNASGGAIGTVSPTWSSSAVGVATVNASGIVTGVSAGTAIITARAPNGVSGAVNVTVTSGAGVLAALTVNIDERTIELGQTTQATVNGVDGQGNPVALGSRTVTWSTSLPTVATVSSSGVVSGVGVGIVDIQVSVADGAVPKTGSVRLIVSGIAGAPNSVDIFMTPLTFSPFQAVVKQNGTVRWLFTDIVHNVIWDRRLAGFPADINNTSNQTVTRTFPTVGVFKYTCTLHPGMDGEIIVTP